MTEHEPTLDNIITPESEGDFFVDTMPLSPQTLLVMDKLRQILPYLDDNLAVSTELLEKGGVITKDVYDLIALRHTDANIAISSIDFDSGTIDMAGFANIPDYEKKLTDIASWCIIDFRDRITMDLKGDDMTQGLNLLNELLEALRDVGYTKKLPMYNIPMKG